MSLRVRCSLSKAEPVPTADDPRQAPIEPYWVTVQDVADLCPDVAILDAPNEQAPYLTSQLTVPTVARWIGDISAMLAGRLAEADRITDDGRRSHIAAIAGAIAVNQAASWVEAAAHPTQALNNASSYAAVLADRYTAWLDTLEALIARWITDGGDNVQPEPGDGTAGSGSAFGFPGVTFADGLRW